MTVGKPRRVLISFAIPTLFSVVFQQIYNIADSIIAGKFINSDALAAIGASTPIVAIFMAFAVGLNMGCSVDAAQLFGAGKIKDLRSTVSTSYILAAAVSVILTALGLLFSKPILIALGTPESILADSLTYLNVYILGLIFLFFYNISSGLFSALGDSKTPLYFLIASSLSNIVLDIIFVQFFGVAGIAWATFAAQGICGTIATVTLLRRVRKLETKETPPLFSKRLLSKVLALSVPCIMQQSFISVGNVFVQGLINSHGADVIAGFSAAMKLNVMVLSAISAMGGSLSNFAGQNLGAGKPERVKEGFKASIGFNIIIAGIFSVIFSFFGKYAMQLFVKSSDTAAITAGAQFLIYTAPFYCVIVFKFLSDAVLKGAGKMFTFSIATLIDLILRVALAFILNPIFGAEGIWVSWPIGWIIATVISLAFYYSGGWRKGWQNGA